MLRVNKLLSQEIAKLIQDEFLGELGIISVLDVDTSYDLKQCRVFISIACEENQQQILKKLQSKSFDFQSKLAKKLTLKYVPKVQFIIDESQENIDRINKILDEI